MWIRSSQSATFKIHTRALEPEFEVPMALVVCFLTIEL